MPAGRHRDDRSDVRSAVAEVATEADVNSAAGEGKCAALLIVGGLVVGRRHVTHQADAAVCWIKSDQQVKPAARLRDKVRQVSPRIVDAGAGDAERIEVSARLLAQRERRAHPGAPPDCAGSPVQAVDLVGLGRRDDRVADH